MTSPAPSTLPAGYPAELQRTWQPAGGPAVVIRALRPDDLELEVRFIAGLSGPTLYQRLQYVAREVPPTAAARLLDMDYVGELALGALVEGPSGPELVGVSRYARIPGTDRAECAIVVADRWQGRGLGTELMRSLVLAARARGLRALEGHSLPDNPRVGEWARRFGFHARTEPNSGGMVRVVLDLTELPQ